MADPNVAVFIDWENLYVSIQREYGEKKPDASFLAEAILNEAKHHGIPIARAYANWDNFPGVMNTLKGIGVEPHQPYSKREENTIPDAADIALCLDAVETCLESTHIDIFVVASGDADYIELINRLLRRGKAVYFLGLNRTTSKILKQQVGGRLTFLDAQLSLGTPSRPLSSGAPDTMVEMVRLVDALENSRMAFVGLKYLRDKHGVPQKLISEAVSVGVLEVYKPGFPR